MKTTQTKSTIYCPPTVDMLVVDAEGILCVSAEGYTSYEGNDKFMWED